MGIELVERLVVEVAEKLDSLIGGACLLELRTDRTVSGDPELAALELAERAQQNVDPLPLDQASNEEVAEGIAMSTSGGARRACLLRKARDERSDDRPCWIRAETNYISRRPCAVCHPRVRRANERAHPWFC